MSVAKGTTLAELERVPESYAFTAISQQVEDEPSEEH